MLFLRDGFDWDEKNEEVVAPMGANEACSAWCLCCSFVTDDRIDLLSMFDRVCVMCVEEKEI
jgi:hypothetical protein